MKAAVEARNLIGHVLMTSRERVDRWRLRLFSRVTGQTDPIYLDEAAACAAGHRDLVAPPTFVLALELEQQNPRDLAELIGFDPSRVLHAEQEFLCHATICAGDELVFEARLAESYEKNDGKLRFLVRHTCVRRHPDDLPVADIRRTIVVRQP